MIKQSTEFTLRIIIQISKSTLFRVYKILIQKLRIDLVSTILVFLAFNNLNSKKFKIKF